MTRKEFFGWLAFFVVAMAIAFGVVPLAHSQGIDNAIYVKQFTSAGNTVGQLVAAAQKSCPSAPTPCILVVDPSLAGWTTGTMPTLCGNCYLMDWRNGPPLPTGGSFSGPITAGQINGVFNVDGKAYSSIAAAQAAAALFELEAAESGATSISTKIDGTGASSLGTAARVVSGFYPMIQLNTSTNVASFPVWPTPCVSGGNISCIPVQYTLLLPGNTDMVRSTGGPFVFEQSTIVSAPGAGGSAGAEITLEDSLPAAVVGQENNSNVTHIIFHGVRFSLPASGPGSAGTQSCVYFSLAGVPNAQVTGEISDVNCSNFVGDQFHFSGAPVTDSAIQGLKVEQIYGNRTTGSGYGLFIGSNVGNNDWIGDWIGTPVPNNCDGTGAGTDIYNGVTYQTFSVVSYQITTVRTAIVNYTQSGLYGGQIDPLVPGEAINISGLTGTLASYLNGNQTIVAVPTASYGAGASGQFTVTVSYGSTLALTTDAGSGYSKPANAPYSNQFYHPIVQGGALLWLFNGTDTNIYDNHSEGGNSCVGVSNTQFAKFVGVDGGAVAVNKVNFVGGYVNGAVGVPNATNTAPVNFNASGAPSGLVLNVSNMQLPCITNSSGTTVMATAPAGGLATLNFSPTIRENGGGVCTFQNVVPIFNEPSSGPISTGAQSVITLTNTSSVSSLCNWTQNLNPGDLLTVLTSGSNPVVIDDSTNSACTSGNVNMEPAILGCTSCQFPAGKALKFQVVDTSSVAAPTLQLIPNLSGQVHTIAYWSTAPISTDNYVIGYGTSASNTTLSAVGSNTFQTPFPSSGTVSGLQVWLTTDPGNGNTVVVTFTTQAGNSSVTCTVTGNGSTSHSCVDVTHSAAVTQSSVASKQAGGYSVVFTGSSLPSSEAILITNNFQ
jgi:hypothetical protein